MFPFEENRIQCLQADKICLEDWKNLKFWRSEAFIVKIVLTRGAINSMLAIKHTVT